MQEPVTPASAIASLSPREAEVAQIIIEQGLMDKEIAALLKISLRTVNTHVQNIHAKLGVNSDRRMLAELRKRQIVIERNANVAALRQDIFRLLGEGLNPYQIAKRLAVHVNCVYYHRKHP